MSHHERSVLSKLVQLVTWHGRVLVTIARSLVLGERLNVLIAIQTPNRKCSCQLVPVELTAKSTWNRRFHQSNIPWYHSVAKLFYIVTVCSMKILYIVISNLLNMGTMASIYSSSNTTACTCSSTCMVGDTVVPSTTTEATPVSSSFYKKAFILTSL